MPEQSNKKSSNNDESKNDRPGRYSSRLNIHPNMFYDKRDEGKKKITEKDSGNSSPSYSDPQDDPNFYSRKTRSAETPSKEDSPELTQEQKSYYRQQIKDYQDQSRDLMARKRDSKSLLSVLLIISSFLGAASLYAVSLIGYGSTLLGIVSILLAMVFCAVAFGAALGMVGWSFVEVITRTDVLR